MSDAGTARRFCLELLGLLALTCLPGSFSLGCTRSLLGGEGCRREAAIILMTRLGLEALALCRGGALSLFCRGTLLFLATLGLDLGLACLEHGGEFAANKPHILLTERRRWGLRRNHQTVEMLKELGGRHSEFFGKAGNADICHMPITYLSRAARAVSSNGSYLRGACAPDPLEPVLPSRILAVFGLRVMDAAEAGARARLVAAAHAVLAHECAAPVLILTHEVIVRLLANMEVAENLGRRASHS